MKGIGAGKGLGKGGRKGLPEYHPVIDLTGLEDSLPWSDSSQSFSRQNSYTTDSQEDPMDGFVAPDDVVQMYRDRVKVRQFLKLLPNFRQHVCVAKMWTLIRKQTHRTFPEEVFDEKVVELIRFAALAHQSEDDVKKRFEEAKAHYNERCRNAE